MQTLLAEITIHSIPITVDCSITEQTYHRQLSIKVHLTPMSCQQWQQKIWSNDKIARVYKYSIHAR